MSYPYSMQIYVDGGCRGNGYTHAIGAAAAVHILGTGGRHIYTRRLPSNPRPTNQRAEITAIILALDMVIERYEIEGINLKIHPDSEYAIGCMNQWIDNWRRNGWYNASGNQVANQDLIREASALNDRIKQAGNVEYIWVPRERNVDADRACNEEMDRMQRLVVAEDFHYSY